jgi:hypothetical protein
MPGLTFQSLQTPESVFQQQLGEQKKQLQEQFKLGWDEINRRGATLGQAKRDELLAELHSKAKMKALELTQAEQSQAAQFKTIDDMAKQGLVNDPDRAKWHLVLGPDADRMMKSQEEPDIMAEYGKADVYGNRIDRELEGFLEQPGETVTKKKMTGLWGSMGTSVNEKVPSKLYTARYKPVTDPKTGQVVEQESWDLATPEEETEYRSLQAKKQTNERLKAELSGQIEEVSRLRRVAFSSPKMLGGGAFEQKVSDSVQHTPTVKQLDRTTAETILREAGGDNEKARQIARARGYSL